MAIVAAEKVRKSVAFDARYTSRVLNERIRLLEGTNAVIHGLQVVRTGAGTYRVFPGRALINGVVVDLVTAQDVTRPVLLERPFSLYLRSNLHHSDSAVFLDFAKKNTFPRDGVAIRDWPLDPIGGDLVVASTLDPLLSSRGAVVTHRAIRVTAVPNQTSFSLDGLAFDSATHELLVWSDGTKLRVGSIVGGDGAELSGLRTITLAAPLATGLVLEMLVLEGVRFREVKTGPIAPPVTLALGHSYTPVLSDLLVFKNGLLLQPPADYAETSSTSFTPVAPVDPGDKLEIYGVNGMLHRETFAIAAQLTVDLVAHGYRPGSHDLLVFGGKKKRVTARGYRELNPEQVELVRVKQASRTATSPVPGPIPDSTFIDTGASFFANGVVVGDVLRITAVTGALQIGGVPQVPPFEVAIASVNSATEVEIVGQFTADPGNVTYEVRTPSFTGTIDTVLLQSRIRQDDILREIGERLDLGRGGGDALLDPLSQRPGPAPPNRDNPFITLIDLQENLEVIAARGTFDRLFQRLDQLNSGAIPGTIVTHGERHVQGGIDAVAVATPAVDGFMSAADKTVLDGHIGAGGIAHALVIPDGAAGFQGGADKAKEDRIDEFTLYNGVWALDFFSGPITTQDPRQYGILPGMTQEKSAETFFLPTRDGSVPEIDSTKTTINLASLSFVVRLSTIVEVEIEIAVFFGLQFVFHFGVAVFVDGVNQPVAGVGVGRVEGNVNLQPGTRRIDVVYFQGGGQTHGCRCSLNADLFDSRNRITWLSAPGF